MKSHDRFMEEVKDAVSLPAQTKKALAPESNEDMAIYNGDSEAINNANNGGDNDGI